MAKYFLLLSMLVGCAISGCVTSVKLTPEVEALLPAYPSDYREMSIEMVNERLDDPEVRQSLEWKNWGDPVPGYQQGPFYERVAIPGWIWRVELNGKNQDGDMTEFQILRFLFNGVELWMYDLSSWKVLKPFEMSIDDVRRLRGESEHGEHEHAH